MAHAEVDAFLSLPPAEPSELRSSTPVGLNGYFDPLTRNVSHLSLNGSTTPKISISSSQRSVVSEGLNVVIPMGGIGSRFQQEGYRFPKPLIKIVGRPMLCWLVERLSISSEDTLWLAVNEDIENEFQIGDLMKKWFPKTDSRLIKLNYLTRGATETLFIVTQTMPASHRRRRTISLDCDTIYFADVLKQVRQLPPSHGGCFYFEDHGPHPIFSYIQTDDNKVITDIQEKNAISTHANTGAYVFPSAAVLNQWATISLDSKLHPDSDNKIGEYYTSQLIELMIKTGKIPFTAIQVDVEDFSCVGSPRQLDEFLIKVSAEHSVIKPTKQRFCFDLDMTLVGMPEIAGDYSTCPPLWNNIELVRALHRAGHHIIIQTARRMRTHNGNLGAVIADIGAVTIASLAKYQIPYDEIFFGKPYAHIYVDDLAVNANLDTRKEIGWLAADIVPEDTNKMAELKHAKKAGIVPSRDFNHVQIIGEKVMKSSKSSKLLAEMYFYSHLPQELAGLFPQLYLASYFPETSTYSFTMQKLQGVSFSHLITARSLTAGRLRIMLQALRKIHTYPRAEPPESTAVTPKVAEMFEQHSVPPDQEVNIYANYASKLKSRYEQYRECYRALGEATTSRIYNTLLTRLEAYEASKAGTPAAIIHGDPVFSNIILSPTTPTLPIRFYDVRSLQGPHLTLAGDICYDLAKVLQSLQGYDHILLSSDDQLTKATSGPDTKNIRLSLLIKPEDRMHLAALQEAFWHFVHAEYGATVDYHTLLSLTASLLMTLIPLHRPLVQPIFLQMCENILEHDTAFPL